MINLSTLEKLSCNGVYCLVNELEKKVDVRYASNLLVAIAGLLAQIKDGSVDCLDLKLDFSKFELVVLEKNISSDVLKIRHENWVRYYRELGYKLYRKNVAAKWKLVNTIEKIGNEYYFIVKLVSKNRVLVVGIFDDDRQMNEFLEKNYKQGVQSIVYGTNSLTSKYKVHYNYPATERLT